MKGRKCTTGHRKAGKLLKQSHLANKDGNIDFGEVGSDLLEQRGELIKPTLTQKEAHRHKAGLDRALDDFATLRDEDALLGLEH